MIEVYGSVENALLILENLDHLEIRQLLEDTLYLRKDPKERDSDEVKDQWREFKRTSGIRNIEVTGDQGTKANIADLMSFKDIQ